VNEHFPPLRSADELPTRVLCFAPHPDDEVLGCGAMLAGHVERGDAVRVVVLTGSSERSAESKLAAEVLGVTDLAFLELEDGGLGATHDLAERLSNELSGFAPTLVYGPSPLELHPDHKAAASALIAALAAGTETRVLLYGVNRQVPANSLFDTSARAETKRAAIDAFASQSAAHDLAAKAAAFDRAYTINIDDPAVIAAEGFVDLSSSGLCEFERRAALMIDSLGHVGEGGEGATTDQLPPATAVLTSFNKCDDVRSNLLGLRAQTRQFAAIVVVDNASSDGTIEMIRDEFPEVELIVMPNPSYGACETFNIGFACARTPLTAILDDDVVLPPEWLAKTTQRLMEEPETTAILSTKVVEPGMPESYKSAPDINKERYMSTFRGCASLARSSALAEAGGYDVRLFIYGNERDLTCRLLNLGYRVLQYPGVETFHKTPFGIKMGKRSLFYHARNSWIGMLKYAPLEDLMRMPFLVFSRVILRSGGKEEAGEVTDATGTIGIARSLRETPGAFWVLVRAAFSVLYNIPYCWKHRKPVTAPDFELPIK